MPNVSTLLRESTGREAPRALNYSIDLINGKVWIQYDGTEDGIGYALEAAGIPQEDIVYQIDAKTRITTYTGGSLLKKHATPVSFYLQDTREPTEGIFFYWETDPQDYILSHGAYGS